MSMKRGTAIRNTGWLLAGSIVRMIVQLIIGAISARYLGPSNYGILNYVGAYISLFSIICELGLTITIVNEIVNNNDREGEYVGSAIILRIIAAVFSTASLLLISRILDGDDIVIRGVILIRSLGLVFDSFNTISFWYQSKLQSKYTTIYELVAYVISSAYKVLILILHKDIYWFAAATTVDSFLIAVLLLWGFKKHSTQRLRINTYISKKLIKIGLPFIFSGIMVYIYGQTDRIMIGKMMTQADVGFYSCASTIGTMIGFIPQAIMNSSKTIIMEQHNHNYRLFELRTKQSLALVLWIMNLYAIFLLLFGNIVIQVLFGKDYMPAVSALNVLIWSYGLSYVGTIRNIWLICEDKRTFATVFSAIGAAINVVLNFVLIPIMGIVGASIATVTTQCITTFFAPLLFPQTRRFSILLVDGLFLRGIDAKQIFDQLVSSIKQRCKRKDIE